MSNLIPALRLLLADGLAIDIDAGWYGPGEVYRVDGGVVCFTSVTRDGKIGFWNGRSQEAALQLPASGQSAWTDRQLADAVAEKIAELK
jgi:hypothetical protein